LATLEAVLRGTSNQMPVRLAAVRLAIHAPSRFVEMAGELCRSSNAEIRRAAAWNLGMIAKHRPALVSDSVRTALLQLLSDPDVSVRGEAGIACARAKVQAAVPLLVKLLADRPADYEQWTEDKNRLAERQAMIEARARWAFALGLTGTKDPAAAQTLLDAVKHRAVHQERMLVGFDGAMAASALGRLQAAEAVGVLRDALFHENPVTVQIARALKAGKKPDQVFKSLDPRARASYILDIRMRFSVVPALAEIGSGDARAALNTIVDAPESESQWPRPFFRAQAAEALMKSHVRDSAPMVSRFLAHRVPEVRRSAILACLKKSDPQYRKLLESAAPWAVPWWDVQHRP
jgi:HEAT repeat protein